MTGHKLFTLAALTLLAVACNREAVFPDQGHEQAIDFSAFFAQDATKAAGIKEAIAVNDTIGVFACYTGDIEYDLTSVTPDFMFNQDVAYNGSNWTYSPVKYWPNNSPEEHISFFSYYPYISSEAALKAKDGIIGFSKSYAKGDPWLVYKLPKEAPETQKDLMYGSARLNVQKQPVSENVKFELKHALACLADTVTVKMSDGLYQKMCSDTLSISITGLKIVYSNLTTKARLVLNSTDEPIWKEVISGELLTSREYVKEFLPGEKYEFFWDNAGPEVEIFPPDSLNIDEGHGLFYIPLQIAGQDKPQVEVTLSYRVTGVNDNGNFDDTMIASKEFTPGHPGMKQRLVLTLQDNFNLEADIVAEGISMPADITAENVDYIKADTLLYKGTDATHGEKQIFIIPRTGKYKLEAWGATGGIVGTSGQGAKGGYAAGDFNLSIGDTLFIYVGGKGGDSGMPSGGEGGWNGGGRGGAGYNSNYGGAGGGGATHIAVSDIGSIKMTSFSPSYEGTKLNANAYYGVESSLLLVAGGGGGEAWYSETSMGGYIAFSFGAIGGAGNNSTYPYGNGGGGGGFEGGNANTTGAARDGNAGSSIVNERYNFVPGTGTTIPGGGIGYPDPGIPEQQAGNGLVIITFVKSL